MESKFAGLEEEELKMELIKTEDKLQYVREELDYERKKQEHQAVVK